MPPRRLTRLAGGDCRVLTLGFRHWPEIAGVRVSETRGRYPLEWRRSVVRRFVGWQPFQIGSINPKAHYLARRPRIIDLIVGNDDIRSEKTADTDDEISNFIGLPIDDHVLDLPNSFVISGQYVRIQVNTHRCLPWRSL